MKQVFKWCEFCNEMKDLVKCKNMLMQRRMKINHFRRKPFKIKKKIMGQTNQYFTINYTKYIFMNEKSFIFHKLQCHVSNFSYILFLFLNFGYFKRKKKCIKLWLIEYNRVEHFSNFLKSQNGRALNKYNFIV